MSLAMIALLVAGNRLTGIGPDGGESPSPPAAGPIPLVEPGHTYSAELAADLARFPLRYDPVFGVRVDDGASTYVNVTSRVRRSWTPTAPTPTPTRTVWFFGGSTMFGAGQRDEHTIPSEVAKQAHREGVGLEAVNFGVPGMVQFQEAQLFAHLVATRPPPDAVAFYDGCNEMFLADERIAGRSDGSALSTYFAGQIRAGIEHQEEPTPLRTADPAPVSPLDAARLGAQQYREGVAMARREGAGGGPQMVFFWQPVLATLEPMTDDARLIVANRGGTTAAGRKSLAADGRLIRSIEQASGVDPIDLTGAFDGGGGAVYLDDCHTSEAGADVVARAMWPSIRETLERG